MNLLCLFGHDKEYGIAKSLPYCDDNGLHTGPRIQIRWACRRCPKMGEDCRPLDGAYKVHFGDLEPDRKRWLDGGRGVAEPGKTQEVS